MNEPSPLLQMIPLAILTIPILIINMKLAKRKGRNMVLFFFLSLIPLVAYYVAIHLASLTDKSLNDKIDKILELLESKNK